MLNHTTHPQGRDSHNLNKYIWRFIALSTAQPRVITIEATSETEYAGAFVPHSLAVMQLSADMALNEARAILIADCENGGVMRDDRFNALKQEFDGAPEDTDDALLCVADMMKAAFFLISTSGYRSEGVEILNIASDYAEYVAEARYRRKFPEGVSHE
ncbi:host cell division inhibitor Icd-like protein [Escherichia coli]|uniref:host cell division inhibitor Icd-like protein n=1 Tax=Escherichia coli TaxID=562 RepID=UPI00202BA9C2|nr:host cell division inhibitor Icd-like protein [Escherichia coli]MDI0642211.1 host cell division inhibitor Icd-like protein [Escherichia coli]